MTIFTRPQWCIEPLRPHAHPAVSLGLPLSARRGSHAGTTASGVDQQRGMTRHAEIQACIHHRTGTSPVSARALSCAARRAPPSTSESPGASSSVTLPPRPLLVARCDGVGTSGRGLECLAGYDGNGTACPGGAGGRPGQQLGCCDRWLVRTRTGRDRGRARRDLRCLCRAGTYPAGCCCSCRSPC